MGKIKIAIQGELGAYSHIAVTKLYKDAFKNVHTWCRVKIPGDLIVAIKI